MAYAFVAIPSQTQLQEDIPEDVRGRVFGVLGMLVSVASFLPIILVYTSWVYAVLAGKVTERDVTDKSRHAY